MLLTKFFARRGYLRKHRDGFSLLKEGWGRKLGLTNAVHVGAHLAEERDVYEALGFSDVLWIEASAEIYQDLVRSLAKPTGAKTRHIAVNALASATPGEQLKLLPFQQRRIIQFYFRRLAAFSGALANDQRNGSC